MRRCSKGQENKSGRLEESNDTVAHFGAINQVTLPTGALGVRGKWFSWNKHLRHLQIGRQEVDCPAFARVIFEDDEKRKVDPRSHSFLLWTPCRTQNRLWQSLSVSSVNGFDLCQVSAKVAYEVGTFKVVWQKFKAGSSLAGWTRALLCDQLFTPLSEVLPCGCHSSPFLEGSPKTIGPGAQWRLA